MGEKGWREADWPSDRQGRAARRFANRHSIWRDASARRSGWYGFNVRISRRAVAPRPFLLFDLAPGQTVDISHRYEFEWKPHVKE